MKTFVVEQIDVLLLKRNLVCLFGYKARWRQGTPILLALWGMGSFAEKDVEIGCGAAGIGGSLSPPVGIHGLFFDGATSASFEPSGRLWFPRPGSPVYSENSL